jgi:hypothetical protein
MLRRLLCNVKKVVNNLLNFNNLLNLTTFLTLLRALHVYSYQGRAEHLQGQPHEIWHLVFSSPGSFFLWIFIVIQAVQYLEVNMWAH